MQAAFSDSLYLSNLFGSTHRLTQLVEVFLDGFDQQVLILLHDDEVTNFEALRQSLPLQEVIQILLVDQFALYQLCLVEPEVLFKFLPRFCPLVHCRVGTIIPLIQVL